MDTSKNNVGFFDVLSFCECHKISRAFFYQLIKSGRGPCITKIGNRTLISYESAANWRKEMEAMTPCEAKAAK